MLNKKILIAAFILVVIAQLGVPAKMIWDREDVLKTGILFRFKTAPVDPNDPFMGKYIYLNFEDNSIVIPKEEEWLPGELIYVSLHNDTSGFAKIKSISKTRPANDADFLKAYVEVVMKNNDVRTLTINYPFDRYYMEESKAYEAELTYVRAQQDTTKITYALVSVKNGDAVLQDVMIDGTSIREMVKSNY